MKLSVSQLRRIIKEEVSRMLVMEAVYEDEDPWWEEEPEYHDPRRGDEPQKAKGARKIETIEDFHTWLSNFVTDLGHRNRKDDRRLLLPSYATGGRRENYYTMKDGKLYLDPLLYDAIENERVEMKALKALVPKGVERGLPEAGGSPMSESRRRTNRRGRTIREGTESLPEDYMAFCNAIQFIKDVGRSGQRDFPRDGHVYPITKQPMLDALKVISRTTSNVGSLVDPKTYNHVRFVDGALGDAKIIVTPASSLDYYDEMDRNYGNY